MTACVGVVSMSVSVFVSFSVSMSASVFVFVSVSVSVSVSVTASVSMSVCHCVCVCDTRIQSEFHSSTSHFLAHSALPCYSCKSVAHTHPHAHTDRLSK